MCTCEDVKTPAEGVTPEMEIDDSLVAAGIVDIASGLPSQWHACLAVEGLRTADGRLVAPGALIWRQLPIAIKAQFEDVHGYGETPPSPIVGSITSITRDTATNRIMAEGTFQLDIEAGQQAASMCKAQTLRWGSLDLEPLESQLIEISSGSSDDLDIIDILYGDDEECEVDSYLQIDSGRIMGWTMVSSPAFPQAVIAPIDVPLDIPEPMSSAPMVVSGLVASVQAPLTPPAAWFTDPQLSEATPIEIANDGRIFGHLALWDQCHIGYPGLCVTPPHSTTGYAYFLTGNLETQDGSFVRVGQITYDTGHAKSSAGWQDAAAHYDNTGAVAADVMVGEDSLGIWVAGSMRPGISDEAVRAVRSAALSGDWRGDFRELGGAMELVAALCVTTPGFPIVSMAASGARRRSTSSAALFGMRDGKQISLVASGVPRRNPLLDMAKEIASIRNALAPLLPVAVEHLQHRVQGDPKIVPMETFRKTPTLEQLVAKVNAN